MIETKGAELFPRQGGTNRDQKRSPSRKIRGRHNQRQQVQSGQLNIAAQKSFQSNQGGDGEDAGTDQCGELPSGKNVGDSKCHACVLDHSPRRPVLPRLELKAKELILKGMARMIEIAER